MCHFVGHHQDGGDRICIFDISLTHNTHIAHYRLALISRHLFDFFFFLNRKLQFRDVINDWMVDEQSARLKQQGEIRMRITRAELMRHGDLTNRHIRLRELLLEYSYKSTLVLM